MAGKPTQGNPEGAPARRPAIAIETDFDEPSRAKVSRAKAAADRSSALPTARSNSLIWSIVAVVIGAPIIAVIWLVAMPDDTTDRYPPARIAEAQREMNRMAEKAQILFTNDPAKLGVTPTPESLGMTQADLAGEYSIEYDLSYKDGILTVFAHNMYAAQPTDLIMIANLRTGNRVFNDRR